MRTTTLLLLPLLTACGPVFKLDDEARTCAVPFLDWTGGLTRHVLQGNGNGEFDWDPADPGVARVAGAYDLKTGGIDYQVEYDAGHARVRDVVTGSGTLWPDGDMDVGYEVATTWADGSQSSESVREKRFGCDVSERRESTAGVELVFGTYVAEGMTYSREFAVGDRVLVADGLLEPTYAYTESVDYADQDYEFSFDEVGDASGTVVRDLVDIYDEVSVRGSWTRQPSGETLYDYRVNDRLDRVDKWLFTLDLAGTGTGTVDLDGTVCNLEVVAFACEKKGCGRDFNGPCTIPLLEPR